MISKQLTSGAIWQIFYNVMYNVRKYPQAIINLWDSLYPKLAPNNGGIAMEAVDRFKAQLIQDEKSEFSWH